MPALLAERLDWAGFSCTMPLKRAALALADRAGADAVAVGAANTLLPLPGGHWRAENTDVTGIVDALSRTGAGSATVLGAGGTAQAAVVALRRLGLARCTVLVRDPARTGQVRATAERAGVDLAVGLLDPAAPALRADLVIVTLPPGAADPIAGATWRAGQRLLDVVYQPWPTRLAAAAAADGAAVTSGAAMLLHQAVEQVRLMTGRPAPVAAMREALRAARPGAGL